MPSSPPCLCGTSYSDPLHTVIRGPATESQTLHLAAGKQWERRGVALAGALREQTPTAARGPTVPGADGMV